MARKVLRVVIGLVIFGAGVVISILQYKPGLMLSVPWGNAIIGGLLTCVGLIVIFWPLVLLLDRQVRVYRQASPTQTKEDTLSDDRDSTSTST
jgi:hypothetical protein